MNAPLLCAIALAHLGLFYLLGRALAPDFTANAQREVLAAFQFTPPPEEQATPPPSKPSPSEGAQAEAGRDAVPAPVSAPTPKVPVKRDERRPEVSASGNAVNAGARAEGSGTGASGKGVGTGSGRSGSGRGGAAATKPRVISGSIDNARDFPIPPGGRAARMGTQVIVKVIVGVDGRARDCSVYRPGPDADANARTCQLVEERLRFEPARDASGKPVPAPFYWRQRWF